ncbi:hypothetical protein [Okeania sp. KiyG1]|uniref:hypothetical protein n=1 Tax=Okeania sp. KiyG1 TaxID=2720165 RepID=UPI00192042FA|nr:hypothetical protein [Okeania sp. KiyG1]GGA27372.1 hypothetical protein CYANOKiyG1_43550 [Okeania sp. KiyG1]
MKKVKHYTKRQIENLIKEQILKECISEQFEGHLENNLLLVEEGIIDSINIFRLISILEKSLILYLTSKSYYWKILKHLMLLIIVLLTK